MFDRMMPVSGRSAFGANPELGPIALALVYLPEIVEKCRRGGFGWLRKEMKN